MAGSSSEIFYTCAIITNFQPPLNLVMDKLILINNCVYIISHRLPLLVATRC